MMVRGRWRPTDGDDARATRKKEMVEQREEEKADAVEEEKRRRCTEVGRHASDNEHMSKKFNFGYPTGGDEEDDEEMEAMKEEEKKERGGGGGGREGRGGGVEVPEQAKAAADGGRAGVGRCAGGDGPWERRRASRVLLKLEW
ncbi:hypothetical protein B296_00037992 [Ensete ventricosum]|uniref:Uncharacterized protein n=1 Tax=Ensete ventricosum TaxID=4639 RepID=A0A426ZFE8_ENSVE|nr:hypothetical protein B296_00037992 [Ensete ventricosum]